MSFGDKIKNLYNLIYGIIISCIMIASFISRFIYKKQDQSAFVAIAVITVFSWATMKMLVEGVESFMYFFRKK